MGTSAPAEKQKLEERGAFMALSENGVPKHIAIIMDGNGRWAKKRGLPRNAGHAAGAEAFRNIANYCRTLGVQYLTVYAFSTENWKRSEEEVSGIMRLMGRYLKEALQDMQKNHVRIKVFGDLSRLSPELRQLCEDAQEQSKDFDDVQVNFCLNNLFFQLHKRKGCIYCFQHQFHLLQQRLLQMQGHLLFLPQIRLQEES